MSSFKTGNTARQWARVAMRVGLMFTDPSVWSDASEKVSSHMDDVHDALNDRYGKVRQQLKDTRDELLGNDSSWVGPVASFVGGAIVGAGVAILLAPASGEDTRAAIRTAATNVTRKASSAVETPLRSRAAS
jgi:gas vesicle protein